MIVSSMSHQLNRIPFVELQIDVPPVDGVSLPPLQLPNAQIVPPLRVDCHIAAPSCSSFKSSYPKTARTSISDSS